MKYKLLISIIFLFFSILTFSSIFIWKEYKVLINVQIPMIILFGYLWTTFGVSFIFDLIKEKSQLNNRQNKTPYSIFIKISKFFNFFIFIFFGIFSAIAILILILSDLS